MLVISIVGKWSQEDQDLNVILSYMSLRPGWATQHLVKRKKNVSTYMNIYSFIDVCIQTIVTLETTFIIVYTTFNNELIKFTYIYNIINKIL